MQPRICRSILLLRVSPLILLPSSLFSPFLPLSFPSMLLLSGCVLFLYLFGTRDLVLFCSTIPLRVVVGPTGTWTYRERKSEEERDRRSEQRKITTVNDVVQQNAATVANATMYRQLPCRCRYRDPANIYSYDNRYAAAGYLNSAACNPRISALYTTPTLLRDLCFAPTFRLFPFVAAICPIDLQLCIHNVGFFNVRICPFSGIVRNCYTESISLTNIVLPFVTTGLFIITRYIRCFASLSILRKTEYQSKNRNMKDFCPTTTRTCKMIVFRSYIYP